MRKGQMLVEVIIAISIALVALIGIVQVANKSVNNSGVSRRQAEATTLGTEVMEWIVVQRDLNGWDNLVNKANGSGITYCFSVSPPVAAWPVAGGCGVATLGSPVQFTRSAALTLTNPPTNNEVTIVVTVSWNEGGRTLSSEQIRSVGRY